MFASLCHCSAQILVLISELGHCETCTTSVGPISGV